MQSLWSAVLIVYGVTGSLFHSSHDGSFHWHYHSEDPVHVKAHYLLPFYNPIESYPYNSLPWPCNKGEHYNINFKQASSRKSICGEKSLSADDVNAFIEAIDKSYQYELDIDGLPVRGLVGFKQSMTSSGNSSLLTHGIITNEQNLYFLITHRHFHLKYNKDQIITVNVSTKLKSDHYVEIKRNIDLNKVSMTYSVSWSSTNIPYSDRMDAQIHFGPTKTQLEAHWLWILNSTLLVVLLTGLLSMILLRTLKNDVARYFQIDELDQEDAINYRQFGGDNNTEFGWKRLKFDVFRLPSYPYLFSAIIGNGAQLLTLSITLLLLAVIGYFYPGAHSKHVYISGYFLYLPCAYINGFVSSKKLKELLGGNKCGDNHSWVRNCLYSTFLFKVPVFIAIFINAIITNYYHSNAGLSIKEVITLILMTLLFTLPLNAFGSYRGRKVNIKDYPCNTKKIARPLPDKQPWYLNSILLVLISGFLPFLSIYVELHTIFLSIFGNKPYTLFGILLITFIILLIVTSFVGILITYFQLNSENYNWFWISLIRGGSCGLFILFYSIYYYYNNYHTHNILVGSIYFTFTSIIASAIALILSSIAHWSSRWFIIRIYDAIKAH